MTSAWRLYGLSVNQWLASWSGSWWTLLLSFVAPAWLVWLPFCTDSSFNKVALILYRRNNKSTSGLAESGLIRRGAYCPSFKGKAKTDERMLHKNAIKANWELFDCSLLLFNYICSFVVVCNYFSLFSLNYSIYSWIFRLWEPRFYLLMGVVLSNFPFSYHLILSKFLLHECKIYHRIASKLWNFYHLLYPLICTLTFFFDFHFSDVCNWIIIIVQFNK